jgi:cobalt-zinc-cadmium efflux system membrane fusion protein
MKRIAVVLLTFAACEQSNGTPSPPATPDQEPSLFVVPAEQQDHLHIVAVEKKSVVRPVAIPGLVAFDALKTSEVTPLVSGKVTKVLVREGDHVTKGQPLLAIASPDSSDATTALVRDRADLRSKQTILARDKDLYEHKAIALEELQQAQLDVESSQAAVHDDEAHVSITGSANGGAALLSPIDGVVVDRKVSVGDAVSAASTPCFTITDPKAVWVIGQLYQEDLKRVQVGDVAHVRSPVLDTPLDGTILYIGASIDPDSLTIPVRVSATNPGVLKSGMYVDLELIPSRTEDDIVVPVASVLRDEDNLPFVYLQTEPGTFARRPIGLGEQVGDQYVISRGLAGGEQVLADGALFVQFADSLEQ